MRRFIAGIAVGVCLAVVILPLTKAALGAARAAQPETTIVADQSAGAVKIIVSGKEVARFNAAGLHVRNDVEYGGTLTDRGVGGVEDYLGATYGK